MRVRGALAYIEGFSRTSIEYSGDAELARKHLQEIAKRAKEALDYDAEKDAP